MKKILVLLGAMVLLSGLASANSIFEQCPTNIIVFGNTPGLSSSATVNCSAVGAIPGGDVLLSVEVYYTADYTSGSSATTISYAFTPGGTSVNWGMPNNNVPATCTIVGNSFSTPGQPCQFNNTVGPQNEYSTANNTTTTQTNLNALWTSGFSVGVTVTETAGFVSGASFGDIVEFDYSTPAPEPASLMMVGGGVGLLGLAQFVGKYLKKKS